MVTVDPNRDIIASLLEEMKVFKMNDCDNVAALNGETAKRFYEKETGFTLEEIEEEFQGEVNKHTNRMYYFSNDLTEEEIEKFKPVLTWASLNVVAVPYDWAIKKNHKIYPYIISTTEQ